LRYEAVFRDNEIDDGVLPSLTTEALSWPAVPSYLALASRDERHGGVGSHRHPSSSFPPMQRGAFNLSALREELEKKWRLMPRRAAH
jgi:hypothetical protein